MTDKREKPFRETVKEIKFVYGVNGYCTTD